ncbi:unnamed protein product [Phytophthora lilii]|uniref:Unnamed protein product n=1 Tax=Phytophthora lilii TaxID=2077276 RepID=A0A9W6XIL6_9STRA|nr:unnamed protein product [Phytophthora lilii]
MSDQSRTERTALQSSTTDDLPHLGGRAAASSSRADFISDRNVRPSHAITSSPIDRLAASPPSALPSPAVEARATLRQLSTASPAPPPEHSGPASALLPDRSQRGLPTNSIEFWI